MKTFKSSKSKIMALLLAVALLLADISVPMLGTAANASESSGKTGTAASALESSGKKGTAASALEPSGKKGTAVAALDDSGETEAPDSNTYSVVGGGKHGMWSEDKELTIAVFAAPYSCVYTKQAMKTLSGLGLPVDKVDICYINGSMWPDTQKEDVTELANEMNLDNVTFCYCNEQILDQTSSFYTFTKSYAALAGYIKKYCPGSPVGSPTFVLTDSTGTVRHVSTGVKDPTVPAQEMIEMIEKAGFPDLIPENARPACTNVECEVTYGQTNARQMLQRINDFRTGEDAWEYDRNNEKVVHTDLQELRYDYDLEKIAMQRAAEVIAAYEHTRPNGYSPDSLYGEAFASAVMGENIAIGSDNTFMEEKAFTLWQEENEDYYGQGHRRNMLYEGFTSVDIGHVVYKGWHFWVQEFSGTTVNTTETEANDELTRVTIPVLNDIISEQAIVPEEEYINIKVGEKKPAPQSRITVKTTRMYEGTYSNSPLLEYAEPITASWDVPFASQGYLALTEDGELLALKKIAAGWSVYANLCYEDITSEIWVDIQDADPDLSPSPEPSLEPESSMSPEPSGKPTVKPSGTPKPTSTQKPTTTGKPTNTQNPTTTKRPTTTKKPTATKRPTTTKKPAVSASSAAVGKQLVDSRSKGVYVVTSAGKAGRMPEAAYKKPSDTKQKTVVIPSQIVVGGVNYRVTGIAAKAFKKNKKVSKVFIANTVRQINASAFEGCSTLKSVTMGTGVMTIAKNAFKNCRKLSKVTIKSSIIQNVGKNAWKGIPKKAVFKVPRAKRSIYKKRFAKAGLAKNVKLKA